jgi:exopolysaccharide biosynthesis polyprenyl glycosylphosphotransferase
MDIVYKEQNFERISLTSSNRFYTKLKRITDVVLASTMLVAASPILAATAIAIKIDSPGPAIYKQDRVGQFGKLFTMLKFRSMSTDAEADGKPKFAQVRDPRITKVGNFIRATRIDELPQLINVIKGEMSLVGPRPERPYFVNQISERLPRYFNRLEAKPGLTGWAQVNQTYSTSVTDNRGKLEHDLYYIEHQSFWLDCLILLSTIRVVLNGEGAR